MLRLIFVPAANNAKLAVCSREKILDVIKCEDILISLSSSLTRTFAYLKVPAPA